jgi:hypothetical protein
VGAPVTEEPAQEHLANGAQGEIAGRVTPPTPDPGASPPFFDRACPSAIAVGRRMSS